jgi:hypothetical protein
MPRPAPAPGQCNSVSPMVLFGGSLEDSEAGGSLGQCAVARKDFSTNLGRRIRAVGASAVLSSWGARPKGPVYPPPATGSGDVGGSARRAKPDIAPAAERRSSG